MTTKEINALIGLLEIKKVKENKVIEENEPRTGECSDAFGDFKEANGKCEAYSEVITMLNGMKTAA